MNGNFKIRALKDNDGFVNVKKGDIIEFKDGIGTFRDGHCTCEYTCFNDFLDGNYGWKIGNYFEEIKEGENMRYWKCVKSHSVGKFTEGKVYKTYNDGNGLVADSGETGWVCPKNMNIVAQFKEVKEGENKMEDLRELIKPCMVVKFRDDVLTMVYDTQNGINFNTETNGYTDLKSLNEQLLYKDDSHYDIVEIYGLYPCTGSFCHKISTKDRPLIWKREEKSPTQLKIEEIESTIAQLTNQVNELKSK